MSRKRVIKIRRAFSFIVAIVLTVVIAFVVYQKSGLLSHQLSTYINDHYLDGTGFRFTCGRIGGDLMRHVEVNNAVLRYEDDDRTFELFRADRITLDYNLMKTVRLELLASNLEVNGVRVLLREDDDGNLILPLPERDDLPTVLSPRIEVASFSLRDVLVERPGDGPTSRIRSLDLSGSFSMQDGVTDFRIASAGAQFPDVDLRVQSLDVVGRIEGRNIDVRDLTLRTDRSLLMVSGEFVDGELKDVQAVGNPLSLWDVAALGLINPKDRDGELGGIAFVNGPPDSLSFTGRGITGKAIGLAFSGVEGSGVLTPGDVHVSRVDATVFGSRVNGSVHYDRDTGDYELTGVVEGLDITDGFIKDEGVPPTDLSGFISLQHRSASGSYEVRGDMVNSSIEGFEGHTLQGRIAWLPSSGLRIRSFTLERPGFELTGSGTIDNDNNAEFFLALEGDNTDYLMDYIELPHIGGEFEVSGRIIGHLDSLRLNLNGTGRNITYLETTVDSGAVQAEATGIRSTAIAARIDVSGRHIDLLGRRFESPHVLVEATDGEVFVRDFSFSRGDTLVTSDFTVVPGDSGEVVPIEIMHLIVRTPQLVWVSTRPSHAEVEGDVVRLDSLELRANGHAIGAVGSYDMAARGCDVHAWGRDIDLRMVRDAFPVPFTLDAKGDITVHIAGVLTDPAIDMQVDLRTGVIDSIRFDRLTMDAAFDGSGYRVAALTLVESGDSLTATGSWDFTDGPVRVFTKGFDHERAAAADVSFRVNTGHYPLEDVFSAIHQRAYWRGAFTGSLDVTGNLGRPDGVLRGQLVSRENDYYRLPPVNTLVTYRDSLVTIDRLNFNDGSTTGSVAGRLPVVIGLLVGVNPLDERELSLHVEAASSDLTQVAGYLDVIERVEGRFEGQLDISGPMGNPSYSGAARLRSGLIKWTTMPEVYSDIEAAVGLENRAVSLTSIKGATGDKGKFEGQGTATIEGFALKSYDVDVKFSDYTLTSVPEISTTQSGNVRITSRENPEGRVVPDINGSAFVKQGLITMALAGDDAGAAVQSRPDPLPGWYCNIDIDAPKNVWVRNPDLNMELTGDVVLRKDERGLYLLGDLSVLRGSYTLYNNKFRITQGDIDFSGGALTRPVYRITAYTPHRQPDGSEERIFLDLSWPVDKVEPEISLSYSDPSVGYSEADLWRMLGGQVVAGDAGLASGSQFDATGAAQNIASNYLERILNAQMSNTTIEMESRVRNRGEIGQGQREMSIAVGRYLSDDLYLKYRQGLTYATDQEINVEYRISRMFIIRSEIIRYAQTGVAGSSRRQASEEINLDLRFRWEY